MPLPLNVTIHDVKAAHDRIRPYVKHTPLQQLEPNLYLKCEHKQHLKSFKPRGACNAMLRLPQVFLDKGVVSRSSGNFAQGLSYIGKALGVKVTIVMPEHAPASKVESTKSLGARVFLRGHQHVESQALVDELVKEEGLTPLHPFDHNDVIAGQGTAMLEILEDLSTIDIFFCPVSGGGLMSGCATVLKTINPNARVIAVEPEGASDYSQYRQTGKLIILKDAHSIADGLLAPTVGNHCRPLLDAYVDEVITVSEEELHVATEHLRTSYKADVEPSGAAAYAAYTQLSRSQDLSRKIVVCMASGGNY